MTANGSGISASLKWTGEFADPAAEFAYGESMAADIRVTAYICIAAAAISVAAFAPMDVMAFQGRTLAFFLTIRALIAATALGAMLAVKRATTHRKIISITHGYFYLFFILNIQIFDHPLMVQHGAASFPLLALSFWLTLPGSYRRLAVISFAIPGADLAYWGALPSAGVTPKDLLELALVTMAAYGMGAAMRTRFGRLRRQEHSLVKREREVNRELAEAKAAAERMANAKAEFLAIMSHEIRTPMNAVLGMVGLMRRDGASASQARRLDVIDDAGRRLVRLCDEILDLSRFEAGSVRLAPEPVAIGEMAGRVVELLGPLASEKRLALSLHCDLLKPGYLIDPLRWQQALTNLIGNAIKHTDAGEIVVSVTARELGDGRDEVILQVEDSGPGIPDEAKDSIFEPFRQYGLSGRQSGAGLGLAIVSRLAAAMGGAVTVTDRPGGGARFTLALPLAEADVPVPSRGTPVSGVPPLDILVVEDAPENQALLREILEPAGHKLVVVNDGARACDLIRSRPFDVVLMDIRLAGMDGVEAARRIRALPVTHAALIPIVAVTANVSPVDERTYLDAGIDDVLAKPIDTDHLFEILGRHAPAHRSPEAPPAATAGGSFHARALFAEACREQRTALAVTEDHGRLAAIAHRLKGSAATFGFARLSRAAADLLTAAEEGRGEIRGLIAAVQLTLDEALAASGSISAFGMPQEDLRFFIEDETVSSGMRLFYPQSRKRPQVEQQLGGDVAP